MNVSRSERKLGTWEWLFHLGGLSIAGVACAAVLFLVIRPIDKRHAAVLRKQAQLKQVLDLEDHIRNENDRLVRTLSMADQKIERLLDRVPSVPREADFLGQITTLAREVGLQIVDYRPGGTLAKDEYQEMTVSLASEGSYPAICSFLKRIHDLPRLSRIRQLTISPRREGETYGMDMELTIYFAPKSNLATAGTGSING